MDSKTQVLADHMVLFYHLSMNWEEIWGVLKWVLAALAAGFVGQFGKSLAQFLMRRRRAREPVISTSEATNPVAQTDSLHDAGTRDEAKAQAKIEKKKAKAKVKRLKKS